MRSITGSLFALFIGLVAISSCTRTSGVPFGPPHVLRIAYSSDPASLVPLLAVNSEDAALDTLFCQTLIGLSEDNRLVPILVERIPSRRNGDISPDGTRITYHLRHGVRFADGVEFTSADVAFTYRAILDPRNRTVSIDEYRQIVSIQTPDAHTIIITLRQPSNAAVSALFADGYYFYGILPKHAFTDTKIVGTPWEDAPFGTGPFRVTEWRRGERIVLEPNRYFRPRPKLTQILLQIIPDLNSNFVALRSGAVDIGTLTAGNVAQGERFGTIRVLRIPEAATGLLYLNTRASPTDDVHVRRAIAYALDLSALSNAWQHEFPIASGFLPPPIITWKGVAVQAYPHDPEGANRELEAAGWRMERGVRTKNGVPLAGLIAVQTENPIQVRIATVIQSQLAAIGMRVSVKTNPARIWFSPAGLLYNGKATMISESWVGGGDPAESVNLACSQVGNHSFYCSKRFEKFFADQARTPSEEQRDRDFDAMQQLVHDDVPVIPEYYEILFRGVSNRVTGYAVNMLFLPVNAENWDAQ